MDDINRRLIDASRKGDLEAVKRSLAEGADIHSLKDSALREASYHGHLSVVRFLVDQGADIHAFGDLALGWASANGHLPVVRFLVDHGANIHANDDWAFRLASSNGHLPVVQFLASEGANLHAEDDYALRNGTPEVKRYLQDVLRLEQIERETKEAYSHFVSQFQAEPPRGRFPGGREYRQGRELAISRGMRDLIREIRSLTLESPWEQIEDIRSALHITLPKNKREAIEYLREYVSQY